MEEKTVSKVSCGAPTFNVNSLLNSTTIHIIIEVIAICGLSAFFNSKLNKQARIIKELTDKIVEQEETLNKHEELLEKIVSRLNGKPVPMVVPTSSKPVQSQPPRAQESFAQQEPVVSNQPNIMGGIPLNLISDIMNVAVGVGSQSQPKKDSPLPSIEELDSELEAELNDLKTEKNE